MALRSTGGRSRAAVSRSAARVQVRAPTADEKTSVLRPVGARAPPRRAPLPARPAPQGVVARDDDIVSRIYFTGSRCRESHSICYGTPWIIS
jgi:hypothetical protein